jgi:hypothetical protein
MEIIGVSVLLCSLVYTPCSSDICLTISKSSLLCYVSGQSVLDFLTEHRIQIPIKPLFTVCKNENILKFEFDAFLGVSSKFETTPTTS